VAQKLYSLKGVKNLERKHINVKCLWAVWLVWAVLSLGATPAAFAESVQVGGGQGRIRVVFNLSRASRPVVTQKDQSLNVNFPDTVGNPLSISDSDGVESLIFDGKAADIILKGPFTYTGKYSENPFRYTLDIRLIQEENRPCPIVNIQANTSPRGITVDVYVHEDLHPEVRYVKNRRLYLVFKGDVNCTELEGKVSKVPCLMFSGTTKVLGGTALAISLVEGNTDMEVRPLDKDNKVTLQITSGKGMNRSSIYAIAQSSLDQGDVASTIRILKPYKDSLDLRECILLGRAYWKIAYPYYMDAYSTNALKYMSRGIQAMSLGTQRDIFLLEYAHMLLHASQYSDTMRYIKFLKASASRDIAAEAYLMEIDLTNRKKRFQDAFIQDRQMLDAFGSTGIPLRLIPYYTIIQGDTLLGLDAPQRALDLYRKIMAEKPELFAEEPGLYARMAEAAYRLKDFSAAKAYFLLAVNLSPKEDRSDYLISLGDCVYQLGQKDMAVGVLSQVENMALQTESNVIARLKTARIIQEKDVALNGKITSKAFRQIMLIYEDLKSTKEYQEGPLGAIIKIRTAQLYALKGDWNNALEGYKLTWTDTKRDDPIHKYAQAEAEQCIVTYASRLDAAGKYDLVYDIYSQYQDTFMKSLSNPEAAFLMGKALTQLGYLDQARSLLLACVNAASPRAEDALTWLVIVDYQRGDYAKALQWNDKYLLEHPQGKDTQRALDMKGELFYYTNRFAEAVPFLEKSGNAGGPRAAYDLFLLADSYGRLGDTAREALALDRVIASPGTSPSAEKALYLRANLYKDSGNAASATELYRKLLDTYPQTAYREWAQFHLAEAYAKAGNADEATRLLNSVIQRSKDITLRNLAVNFLNEMTLGTDVDEYTRLLSRFGGK
jgi:tetratricopeptide (TPR) repeat protein